ncbi:hypothetical protein L6452_09457 [Arctium lappa]|uniref:Uncharacterized protein n=1 Tax=Arctium lappa TaxID=4217 RepID=A0ACB9DKF0_ARCLA|nr:hypothetical protein L6452_09457 [Arctium lappa]
MNILLFFSNFSSEKDAIGFLRKKSALFELLVWILIRILLKKIGIGYSLSLRVPGNMLWDEHSSIFFSNFSSEKDAIGFLRKKSALFELLVWILIRILLKKIGIGYSLSLRCEESSSFSHGIYTAVVSRKVGAPKVYCSGS